MENRALKDTIFTSVAKMSKAFSNANRLKIIALLANGPKSVEDLAGITDMSMANASHHLQILKSAKLVSIRKDKNYVYYTLANHNVYTAWKGIRDLAMLHEPEIKWALREYREQKKSTGGVSYHEIAKRRNVILLDVRPLDEYNAGHITKAQSIPILELPKRLNELPKNKTIITYCRGAFCTYADEAVELLKKNGFEAVRLEESYLDVELNDNN